MNTKSLSNSFTLILILLVFLGSIANADLSFAKECSKREF